jgi:hypothetical protein
LIEENLASKNDSEISLEDLDSKINSLSKNLELFKFELFEHQKKMKQRSKIQEKKDFKIKQSLLSKINKNKTEQAKLKQYLNKNFDKIKEYQELKFEEMTKVLYEILENKN